MRPSSFDPEALLERARQDLDSDQLAAAQAKCLQVLTAYDHHPGALAVLGRVLYARGQHEEAVRVFNALTLMEPTVAEHWQNLGTVLRPTRRYDQAIAAFDRALRLAPPTSALLYNLGVLQLERCDYNAAYLALRDAVALAPADATIRWGFAQCCCDLVNIDEALEALEDWQKLQRLTVEITVRIAFILVMVGATQQALPAIERLMANPPQKGIAAVGLATILERLHRLDEARAILERLDRDDRSLDNDPEKLKLSAVLAERTGQHEAARRFLSLALENHHQFLQRQHLLFPLAKSYDALGRYEEAFAAAEQAHLSQTAFCEIVMGKSLDKSRILSSIENGCDPDDVATWEGNRPATPDSPIFIVGFPRSGTTLLEQVLDAHPRLVSMDEQPFLVRALAEVTDRGIRYPAELGKLTAQDLDAIRTHYWDSARKKVSLLPGQRLVDKNPLNMTALPLIRLLFPNARIILAIRHPCDVLLSCFLQDFRAPELALLCRDLATMANAYCRIFEFWYSQWPLLRPFSYELRYEKFTSNFATEVRNLAEFLQLPWHEAMLAPGEHALDKGFISTPSYSQVLEPVNSKSVGRWQHYERHFRAQLPVLMPWIERWGYSLTVPPAAAAAS
jgi:tetratricopeptide (TPR) repeat protein